MGRKTPPFKNYPQWTESRFFSFLRSALRQAWSRYPPKYQALEFAARPYVGPDKRQKKEYLCDRCNKWHKRNNVEVDHTIPAGTLTSFEHLPGFVERLFPAVETLRVLCKPCHLIITAEEKQRAKDASNV